MIAAHETSVVAVSKRTGQVLAAGADARRMLVRARADIVLMPTLDMSRPLTIGPHPRPRPVVMQPKRHSRSGGLFVVLCAAMAALSLLSQQSWASGAADAARSALAPAEGALVSAGARLDRGASMFGDVSALRAENERLRAADEQLRSQVLALSEAARENDALRQALDFERSSGFRTRAAQVVGRGPDGFSPTMVLDRGTADGVHAGMVVVTGAGLLGRIDHAGPHTSTVRTLADSSIPVPVVLVNANLQATVVGGGSDQLRIDVPNRAAGAVTKGDWVLTSDAGSNYPPGLVVGEVANVTRGTPPAADHADVAWVNDPARIDFVLVITDFSPS
jgi:rod shape-determining protein MreC